MWCRTGSGMHGRSVLHKLKSHNFHQNEWSKFKNIYRTWNLASQTWMEAFVRFELKSCERRGPLTRNSKLRHESRVRQNVETWCQVFFVRTRRLYEAIVSFVPGLTSTPFWTDFQTHLLALPFKLQTHASYCPFNQYPNMTLVSTFITYRYLVHRNNWNIPHLTCCEHVTMFNQNLVCYGRWRQPERCEHGMGPCSSA